jgi:hypothetical protein
MGTYISQKSFYSKEYGDHVLASAISEEYLTLWYRNEYNTLYITCSSFPSETDTLGYCIYIYIVPSLFIYREEMV